MDQAFSKAEDADLEVQQRWLNKHGFEPREDGTFKVDSFEGKLAVSNDKLFSNIKENVSDGYYLPLFTLPYDERIFVMCCGGPSLANHLDEIRQKSLMPDKYLVACSNMTGGYLLENGITPHVHFILDPQKKKRLDVAPGRTSNLVQYWINATCDPGVFAELKAQGIKPYIFLADFESEGAAIKMVKDSMPPGQPGMMAIQGGTMAGLRAINLADALGFRRMEYYGFDACVSIDGDKVKAYAYKKRRSETIIDIKCDICAEEFSTTLIFQRQVNEFISWHSRMPWIDISVLGGGLIAHYHEHIKVMDSKRAAKYSKLRYTPEYATMQKELHLLGNYGITGKTFIPTIFHAISQLLKKHGSVSVLDYGSAGGGTMDAVRENLYLPPTVYDKCYDPFVDEFSQEPEAADLVICTDVMEHVEPQSTLAVLDHIQSLTKKVVFFSITLGPALKTLSDGRNAHINLRTAEYWLAQIKLRFVISEANVQKDEVVLIVGQSIEAVREKIRTSNA